LADEVAAMIISSMKLEELSAEADKLPEDERASWAARLLHGLQKPHDTVSDEEVMSRVREADENPEVMIPFDQLVSGLRFRAEVSEKFVESLKHF
jgi:hypothetical protein